ncbi:hypothetical protein FZEAL_7988 [Fusarium zealandicum]|uniref:Uncharacterized protein n=1 Tax=Fusarium zealandicum TaxID=1053134 RepID=A0A8H4UFD7_9HYPO|nr:hypothetical protein FZEAL_7988 [Fusarium zealandicum]
MDYFWNWALADVPIDQDYYDEEDLKWVTAVLPVVAFRNISLFARAADPKWSKFQESSDVDACCRMTRLIVYLDQNDPFGKSEAYKALYQADPGFKKLREFGQVYIPELVQERGIYPLDEWQDLDYLLGWIQANAIPRLHAVPDLIAEEAADVMTNTQHMSYYIMFFQRDKTLGEIRVKRLLDQEPESCIQRLGFFFRFD